MIFPNSLHGWRRWFRLLFFVALVWGCARAAAVATEDPSILDPRDLPIRTGSFSKFARFQDQLWRLLRECKLAVTKNLTPEPDTRFGPDTAHAIRAAVRCGAFKDLPPSSLAREGVLTQALWRIVMDGEPMPEVEDLADALVLSFEATDFTDKPEWNFCQDNQKAALAHLQVGRRNFRCYNISDPCSMLTWGPRGATAGQGGEIQWILWKIWKSSPALLERVFGAESANVRRFVRLKRPPPLECHGDSPLEHFMCAVWIDPVRRRAWENGLVDLGRSPLVRQTFRELYASEEFDGYKLRSYYQLWTDLGLRPTEIDYAFFYDRATHIGDPPDDGESDKLRTCVDGQTSARNRHAAARRCLSLQHPHPTMPMDRRARDMAFYVDGYPREALSREEVRAWSSHIPLAAATNFGLSDTRAVPLERVIFPRSSFSDAPPQDFSSLTEAEKVCPAEIRVPIRSRPAN